MSNLIAELATRIIRIASIIQVIGLSRRSARGWIRKHREKLTLRSFSTRSAVVVRRTYVDIGQESALQSEVGTFLDGLPLRLWITGAGGSGKSTLAFELARRLALTADVVPIVLDYTWTDDLKEHLAGLLTPPGTFERPTKELIAKLLSSGMVGLVVDGLSEIQVSDDVFSSDLRGDKLRHLIVTSRKSCPTPELMREVVLGRLTDSQLKRVVDAYVEQPSAREATLSALERFAGGQGLNVLFARLAIDHFQREGLLPPSILALIQSFLTALRPKTPTAPNEEDFLRTCRIAGFACVREGFTPTDISEDYLRGVLEAESGRSSFYSVSGEKVTAFALLETLKLSGVLEATLVKAVHRVNFVYHPIAEYLAAVHLSELPDSGRDKILAEIEASDTVSPNFLDALKLVNLPIASGNLHRV
jgi:hypothetical protein